MNDSITAQNETPTRSRKRLIVPLAGLLIAAAVTVGSGADLVANSVNSANAFSTGTLTQSNSKSGTAIFNAAKADPQAMTRAASTSQSTAGAAGREGAAGAVMAGSDRQRRSRCRLKPCFGSWRRRRGLPLCQRLNAG